MLILSSTVSATLEYEAQAFFILTDSQLRIREFHHFKLHSERLAELVESRSAKRMVTTSDHSPRSLKTGKIMFDSTKAFILLRIMEERKRNA